MVPGPAAVERHVDFEKIKCLIVAGPGFAKESFLKVGLFAPAIAKHDVFAVFFFFPPRGKG